MTFVYDEKNAQGNGIKLSNALPVSDETGKQQIGSNNVFDFQIIATTQGAPIYYEVLAAKGEESTLAEEVVKIYLTNITGSEEEVIDNTLVNGKIATFNQLPSYQIPKYETNKTLYQGTISEGQTKYTQQFRLRMWLSEEATGTSNGEWSYGNKKFTLKVNIYASNEMLPEAIKLEQQPNTPKLVEGMIPVTYDGNKWVKADTSSNWYDYNQQEWANAVTVTENNRTKYINAEVGTEILMDDINTMWVWIPRYEYKYTNLGNQYAGGTKEQPGEIKINFIEGTTTTSSDQSNYKIHPAFTFGEKELSGFWYAKFETSIKESCTAKTGSINTDCDLLSFTPEIKPNKESWRGARIATFFQTGRFMQTKNYAIYGFPNNNDYDIHMSKNSEWGAIAYLSQSRYGKYGNSNYEEVDKEVAINNCNKFITGIGGDTVNAKPSSVTCTTNTYETTKGQATSTTGNITGVYDMYGGSYEFVMGALQNKEGTIISGLNQTDNSGFNGPLYEGGSYQEGISLPDSKYFNTYTTTNMESNSLEELSKVACNFGVCYGYAMSETYNWYNDGGTFMYQGFTWTLRGGGYGMTIGGIFRMANTRGYSYRDYTTRYVINFE